MDNMYRAAAWSLLLVIVLAGCGAYPRHRASGAGGPGPGQAIPVGSSSHTISVGGTSRAFLVYRPATLPAAAPLVVMLHGGFGTGAYAEKFYNWDAEAGSGHFVVAYPDGLHRAWNTGSSEPGLSGETPRHPLPHISRGPAIRAGQLARVAAPCASRSGAR
jgi:polyhydroxybutyrate depolymerase